MNIMIDLFIHYLDMKHLCILYSMLTNTALQQGININYGLSATWYIE